MTRACQFQPIAAVVEPELIANAIVRAASMHDAARLQTRIASALATSPDESTTAVGVAMAIDIYVRADPEAGARLLYSIGRVYQQMAGAPLEAANDG